MAARRDGLSRRATLAGLAAVAAGLGGGARADGGLGDILRRSGLGALSGFVAADAATGAVIEAHRADALLPPASVAKIPTALYALDRLGPGFAFETRLMASGPVAGGRLAGDLTLAGAGDPLIDTDALGELAAALREGGLGEVAGRFAVAAGALPAIREIEAGQPAQAGYNPAISGMNLNFNRVFLAWEPGADGPRLRLSAPGERLEAPAPTIAAELGGSGPPRHREAGGREIWAFAPASLKGSGSLWLPVRAPAPYAGAAFRGLAAAEGLALPEPVVIGPAPPGATLAARRSPALAEIVAGMLRYSTNLTAETLGLRASGAGGLAASGAAMTGWARARWGLAASEFVNHSGLTARSVMTPADCVRMLTAAQAEGLPGLLRERPIRDAAGQPVAAPGVRVLAKTGTLDFVSALAGYVERPQGRIAFAIFAADPAARAAIRPEERDDPPGAAAWERRARAQEQALLRRWAGFG